MNAYAPLAIAVLIVGLAAPCVSAATAPTLQAAPTGTTCEAIRAELTALRAQQQTLQAQLQGSVARVEQNAGNGQAVAQGAAALGVASAVANFVPGMGYAASATSVATRLAIEGQRRATTTTNSNLQSVVQQLAPIGQRIHALETDAAARGCS